MGGRCTSSQPGALAMILPISSGRAARVSAEDSAPS
jgi:hypothetical protein